MLPLMRLRQAARVWTRRSPASLKPKTTNSERSLSLLCSSTYWGSMMQWISLACFSRGRPFRFHLCCSSYRCSCTPARAALMVKASALSCSTPSGASCRAVLTRPPLLN